MEALVQGESDPKLMAGLAKGRLRNKMEELVKALTGVVGSHHRFMLAQHLAHIDFLDEQVATVNSEIGARVEAMSRPPENDSETLSNAPQGKETRSEQLTWAESIEILDTAPGVDVKAAQMVLAETGIDMSQFPNEDHLTSWAGLAPGNNQSGSKRKNAKTREGNRNLREVMIQIAWAASRTKGSYTRALYRRLAARRGKKRAIVAVARSLLVSFYHMLTRKEAYHNLGEDYFDKRRRVAKVDILTKQLQKLGYDVRLEPLAPQVTLA